MVNDADAASRKRKELRFGGKVTTTRFPGYRRRTAYTGPARSLSAEMRIAVSKASSWGVAQHLDGHVDVGHLLLVGLPGRPALGAAPVLCQVVAVVYAQIRERCQGLQVRILSRRLAGVVRLGPYPRGEVADCLQALAGPQQVLGEVANVEPVVALPALGP